MERRDLGLTLHTPWSALADRISDEGARVRTYPAGRKCARPGCGTVLSKYNPLKFCEPHRHLAFGAKRQCNESVFTDAGLKVCTKCGKELPATPEFFTRKKHSPTGLSTECKECKKARYRETHPVVEKVRKFRLCKRCGKYRPQDGAHWRKKSNGQYVTRCRACDAEVWVKRDG